MALAFASLLASYLNANQSSYTFASVTTVAGRGYILWVVTPNTSNVTPSVPTVSGAGGETWGASFTDWLYDNAGGDRGRITAFIVSNAAGGSGAPVVDYAGVTQDGCLCFVTEITGHDTAAVVNATNILKAANTGTVTTISGSLPNALQAATSEAIGLIVHQANEGTTVGSGFTAVGSVAGSSPNRSGMVEHQLNVTTIDASWVTAQAVGLLGLEVQASGGGSAPGNTVAPAVTGTPTRTHTLTTTDGTWTNTPTSFARQWQRDVAGNGVYSDIGGATSSTYVLTAADVGCHVRCNVTATNASGSTLASSNAVGLVGGSYGVTLADNGIELCTDGISVTIQTGAGVGSVLPSSMLLSSA